MRKPTLFLFLISISAILSTITANNSEEENDIQDTRAVKRLAPPSAPGDEPEAEPVQDASGDQTINPEVNQNVNPTGVGGGQANRGTIYRQRMENKSLKAAALAIKKQNMEQKIQIADMKNSHLTKKLTNKALKNQLGTKRPKQY